MNSSCMEDLIKPPGDPGQYSIVCGYNCNNNNDNNNSMEAPTLNKIRYIQK